MINALTRDVHLCINFLSPTNSVTVRLLEGSRNIHPKGKYGFSSQTLLLTSTRLMFHCGVYCFDMVSRIPAPKLLNVSSCIFFFTKIKDIK